MVSGNYYYKELKEYDCLSSYRYIQGEIVRLTKGNFNKKKIYKKNLVEQVKSFQKNGATWIHVVDVEGALSGENKNEYSTKKVIENSNCTVH